MLWDDLELGEDGKVPNVLGARIEVSQFLVRKGGPQYLSPRGSEFLDGLLLLIEIPKLRF